MRYLERVYQNTVLILQAGTNPEKQLVANWKCDKLHRRSSYIGKFWYVITCITGSRSSRLNQTIKDTQHQFINCTKGIKREICNIEAGLENTTVLKKEFRKLTHDSIKNFKNESRSFKLIFNNTEKQVLCEDIQGILLRGDKKLQQIKDIIQQSPLDTTLVENFLDKKGEMNTEFKKSISYLLQVEEKEFSQDHFFWRADKIINNNDYESVYHLGSLDKCFRIFNREYNEAHEKARCFLENHSFSSDFASKTYMDLFELAGLASRIGISQTDFNKIKGGLIKIIDLNENMLGVTREKFLENMELFFHVSKYITLKSLDTTTPADKIPDPLMSLIENKFPEYIIEHQLPRDHEAHKDQPEYQHKPPTNRITFSDNCFKYEELRWKTWSESIEIPPDDPSYIGCGGSFNPSYRWEHIDLTKLVPQNCDYLYV